MGLEDIAARIAGAKANKSGQWIQPGRYLFEVQKLLAERKTGGDMFIAELLILESTSTGQIDRSGKPYVPNAAGTTVGFVVPIDAKGYGDGNVKSFLMALFNAKEEEITTQVILQMTGTEKAPGPQPARFFQIRDEAFTKPQRAKPDKDFTHHMWNHVAFTAEQEAARKERLKAA
jgi:hypothetical protein